MQSGHPLDNLPDLRGSIPCPFQTLKADLHSYTPLPQARVLILMDLDLRSEPRDLAILLHYENAPSDGTANDGTAEDRHDKQEKGVHPVSANEPGKVKPEPGRHQAWPDTREAAAKALSRAGPGDGAGPGPLDE